ncbi:hypothetical protein PI124_g2902 [Phytophthora idaei]|nr:hypothetical protein PI124_g2902 [Phytophthora idaei]
MAKKRKQSSLPSNDERSDEEYVDAEARDGASSDASEHAEASAAIRPAQTGRILGKTFESWAAFFAFWEQFERQNFVIYPTRDCQTAKLYNGKRTNRPDRQVIHTSITRFERCHNHVTTGTIHTSLKQCNDLLNGSALAMLDAFGQTNTETKQITSYVADSIGLPVSTQQVRNFMNARLGHGSAEERLKVVMLEFATDKTNKSAVLQDE